jgi:hypothetical protein
MKSLTTNIFIALILVTIFSSCRKDNFCQRGTGSVEKREFSLAEINRIVLEGSGDVYVRQGEFQKVEIETNNDLFDYVNTSVHDGKWEVDFKGCVTHFKTFKVFITVKDLKQLKVSGSGEINGESTFNVDDLEVAISGSGKINLNTNADNITTSISGSGKINLSGTANDQNISISGSGDVKSEDLLTRTASVKTSGSGKSYVNVSEKLDVKISGSGDVYYKGSPDINSSVSGSGKIEKI